MAKQTDYSKMASFGCVINPMNRTQRYNIYVHKTGGFVSIDKFHNNKIIAKGKTIRACEEFTRNILRQKFAEDIGVFKNQHIIFNSSSFWGDETSRKLGIKDNTHIWLHGIIKEVELHTGFNRYRVVYEILTIKDGKEFMISIQKDEIYKYDSQKFKRLQEQQKIINDIEMSLEWRQKNMMKTKEKLTKLIEND